MNTTNDDRDAGNSGSTSDQRVAQRPAPWLPVPSRAISAVEHPCVVKNVDKGIVSLGGPFKLSKRLRDKLEPQINEEGDEELPGLISVSLRPDDPFAKRLLSTPVATNNLLLKVTVPKRTGRKRKRGSAEPFVADDDAGPSKSYADATAVFRSLQDNASKYSVALAGVIDETHRFRTLPDIQYAASRSSIMAGIRDHLLPGRHSLLKTYSLNTAAGADLTKDVGPSAEYFQMPVAWNYQFQQNPNVKYTKDKSREINMQRTLTSKAYTIIQTSDETVPGGPKAELPPEDTLSPHLQNLIGKIRAQLARRPIITRHLLYNKLGWDKRDRIRQAAVYCGYFFETGPWREALIVWGLDPRKDPAYRHYQTISFLSYVKRGTARHAALFDQHIRELSRMPLKELERQHTFDGVNVSHTGNLFQFCDITDPIIRKVLDTTDIRGTCAPTFQGWYHVGTWAKATVILKDKMKCLIGKETPDDSIYHRILTWPEIWDDQKIYDTYRQEMFDRELHKEKLKEHDVMNYVRWAARNPRYTFEKLEAVDEPGKEHPAQETNVLEDMEVPEDLTEAPDTAAVISDEGEVEDEDEYNEDEYDLDQEDAEEGEGEDEDADGIWEEDDLQPYDQGTPGPSAPEKSQGPRPFGGLY